MRPAASLLAIAGFVAATALAQAPALPALPDPGALPGAPGRTTLPGIDNRQCGTSKWSALCAVGRWTQFSTIDVQVKAAGFTGDYRLEQAANGELHATYREDAPGLRRRGEAVLFGLEGLAYRTRDELPPSDAVIDYLFSAPLMMAKLAAVLLDQGVLGPPGEVTTARQVRAGSSTQFIRTEAPRMAVLYGAPWSMTGTVKPAADGRLAFALQLRYRPVDRQGVPVPGKSDTLAISGTVSYAAQRATLPDTLDLVGWKLVKGEAPLAPVATLEQARVAAAP